MQITCGLPIRHPIVILTLINLFLWGLGFYLRIFVLHEPSYRFPYPLEILGALLLCYAPLYFVANPQEMTRLFTRRSAPRIPDDTPRGTGWKIFGYLYALFLFGGGLILNYQLLTGNKHLGSV
jgi:hypothetical protein